MDTIRNKGVNLVKERQDVADTDYILGALPIKSIAPIPLEERDQYLPAGELQFGKEDWMDCASRAPINMLAAEFTYLLQNGKFSTETVNWLHDNGYVNEFGQVDFSDRFIAIKSGTTRDGNSLKAPLQAIRDHGLIPKKSLPAHPSMTFADYHDEDDITLAMEQVGREFAQRFEIKYERVYRSQFEGALSDGAVDVALFAWGAPQKGIYERIQGVYNHAVALFKLPKWFVFDNYPDAHDGDWIKQLAPDYDFYEWGYRICVTAEKKPDLTQESLLQQLVNVLMMLSQYLSKQKMGAAVEYVKMLCIPDYEKPKTNREKLYEVAKSLLGQDVTPGDEVSDERACAATVTRIVQMVKPSIQWSNPNSTYYMYRDLRNERSFERVKVPLQGDLAICPTGYGKSGEIGHVWIYTGNGMLASNNSFDNPKGKKGTFTENYTLDAARRIYVEEKGFPMYIYRIRG